MRKIRTIRAVAIIGAAYLDLLLRDVITTRLLPDHKLMTELFENRGPLQDFGSRIQVAYALRVCGRAAYKDLRIIKDIRNAFAHSAEPMDFSHKDVTKLCDDLWYPKKIAVLKEPEPHTPREKYIRAIYLLASFFFQDMTRWKRSVGRDPLASPVINLMASGPTNGT
jgi:DNA-binding MltR family transcriptional regulator